MLLTSSELLFVAISISAPRLLQLSTANFQFQKTLHQNTDRRQQQRPNWFTHAGSFNNPGQFQHSE